MSISGQKADKIQSIATVLTSSAADRRALWRRRFNLPVVGAIARIAGLKAANRGTFAAKAASVPSRTVRSAQTAVSDGASRAS
jgi:hypothetical protein